LAPKDGNRLGRMKHSHRRIVLVGFGHGSMVSASQNAGV
jgi:hypothetical protein